MAQHTFETVHTTTRRYTLEAPWPQGVPVGAVLQMIAAAQAEARESRDVGCDGWAWVIPGDGEIILTFDTDITRERRAEPPKQTGPVCACGQQAVYTTPTVTPATILCPVHAAECAATGGVIAPLGKRSSGPDGEG